MIQELCPVANFVRHMYSGNMEYLIMVIWALVLLQIIHDISDKVGVLL